MIKPETFAVIGGDLRYVYLAGQLADDGYKVIAVGFDHTELPACVAGCTDVSQAIYLADAVVLPMPVTADGTTVRAPFSRLNIPLEQVVAAVTPFKPVFAGGISDELAAAFERHGCLALDYLKREELAVENAVPTAEGAVALAMEELPITLQGAACLVTGYGRIGTILAHRLVGMGADVTVAARKCEDRAKARSMGCRTAHPSQIGSLPPMDVIFNTVPSLLFDRRVLMSLDPNTLLIDLASRPGGVDFNTAAECRIKTIWALSLPGRVAPKTAGGIIRSTILNMIREGTA